MKKYAILMSALCVTSALAMNTGNEHAPCSEWQASAAKDLWAAYEAVLLNSETSEDTCPMSCSKQYRLRKMFYTIKAQEQKAKKNWERVFELTGALVAEVEASRLSPVSEAINATMPGHDDNNNNNNNNNAE